MEFKILNYNEGIFDLNHGFEMPKDKNTEVMLKMAPMVIFKSDSDIIGIQLTLFYKVEEIELLKYGYIGTVAINGWNNLIKDGIDVPIVMREIFDAWNAVLNYGRGALDSKLDGTSCKGLIIPDIPLEKLQKILRFENIE